MTASKTYAFLLLFFIFIGCANAAPSPFNNDDLTNPGNAIWIYPPDGKHPHAGPQNALIGNNELTGFAAVPTPSTLYLLAAGILGLVATRKKT